MTKTYGATNPQQIIDLFEMKAKIAQFALQVSGNPEHAVSYQTWKDAADILRNTEFVGWTHDTRIVDTIDEKQLKFVADDIEQTKRDIERARDLTDNEYGRDAMKAIRTNPHDRYSKPTDDEQKTLREQTFPDVKLPHDPRD